MQFERREFRWSYQKPYDQLIVGDGKEVWFYDHDLNQVTVRPFNLAIGSILRRYWPAAARWKKILR